MTGRRGLGAVVVTAAAMTAAVALLAACSTGTASDPQEYRSLHPTTAPAGTPAAAVHLLGQRYVNDRNPRHTLDLTVPGGFTGPRPVVVFIHGGAWRGGDPRSFERSDGGNFAALRNVLLEQGWATASVGYRFSGETRMPGQVHDVKAAVRWVSAHAGRYGLDADRIAVVGESAGGHLAQFLGDTRGDAAHEGKLGITTTSSSVVAVVSLYGVSDLGRVVPDRKAAGCGAGDAGPRSPEGRLIGGDPASPKNRAEAAAASPITYVSATSAPTLFVHGTRDCIVPAAQSKRAAAALTRAGVENEVMLIDAGHAESVFYTSPDVQGRVLKFLRTYLEPA